MDPLSMLEAMGFRRKTARVRKRLAMLRELVKLFLLEARENPEDAAYLLACAKDLYRRYRAGGGRKRGTVREWLTSFSDV
jgi:hypothetical protein